MANNKDKEMEGLSLEDKKDIVDDKGFKAIDKAAADAKADEAKADEAEAKADEDDKAADEADKAENVVVKDQAGGDGVTVSANDAKTTIKQDRVHQNAVVNKEPIEIGAELITLVHAEPNGETLEVTPIQWLENRGRLESLGWRHPEQDSTLTDPEGPRFTHARSLKDAGVGASQE